MSDAPLNSKIDENGVGWVTLNRPELHNAFDDVLIKGLLDAFTAMANDESVWAVVLTSEGKSFSAGADFNWMKRVGSYGPEENKADAMVLAKLLKTMNFMEKPLIGLVQGAAFGGGVGLAACCDIVIASEKASFCLSEVKIGLAPSTISPYVVSAIGAQAARRYFVTAERIDAQEAKALGLVHKLVPHDQLREAGDEMIALLAKNGPKAMAKSKELVFAVDQPLTEEIMEYTAEHIASIRATPEGKEGLGAFLEKRKPSWIKD